MKRKSLLAALTLPALAFAPFVLTTVLTTAQAAPRVGLHSGYTRVVFDLPRQSTPQVSQTGKTLNIRLATSLSAEHGPLSQPGLQGYAVTGKTVTLSLTQPGKAKVQVYAVGGKARLVVDVPVSGVGAVASIPARPITSRPASKPVLKPASARQAARPTVVIDAGHGGVDPGMVSPWVTEKAVTLDVALRVRQILQANGVNVRMVRETDRHLSTDKRTDLDTRSRMAEADTVSAYISIHVNAGGEAAQGIETYYFGQPMGGSTRSLAVLENGGGDIGQALTRQAAGMAQSTMGDILAQAKLSFSRQLAQKVQANLLAQTGAVNRGVHTDAFYVIRNPKTAAILTEIGFGSSPQEGPKLASAAYRARIASGITGAILDFLHVK